jgi:hypothetical protein
MPRKPGSRNKTSRKDKGTRRSSYDSSARKWHAWIRQLKRTQAEIEKSKLAEFDFTEEEAIARAEELAARIGGEKRRKLGVQLSNAEFKRAQRVRLLDRFVKDRRCPACGKLKLASRSWRYVKGRRPFPVICMSCDHTWRTDEKRKRDLGDRREVSSSD